MKRSKHKALSILNLLKQPDTGIHFSVSDWQDAIRILREAKLMASLFHRAENSGCIQHYSAYAIKHLKSAATYAKRQQQQVRFECEEIKSMLSEENIEPVFLKGAGYTLRKSRNSQGRVYSDIDILVEKSQLQAAEKIFKTHLWRSEPVSDYDDNYYRNWAHEVPPLYHLFRGTVVDLHHNLYLPVSGRSPDIDLFLSRTMITDSGCRVFSPAASFLHSVIHLFTNEDSSSGMRDLWDLYLLLSEYADDTFWSDLLFLAKESEFIPELLYCLDCLEYYFGECISNEEVETFRQQNQPGAAGHFLSKSIFPLALVAEHPLLMSVRHRLAKHIIYMRGHWIKMPPLVLFKHLTVKAGISIRNHLLGKHHTDALSPFEPKK